MAPTPSKLTESQRGEIRAAYAAGGIAIRALGGMYGVSHETIRKVVVDLIRERKAERAARRPPPKTPRRRALSSAQVEEIHRARRIDRVPVRDLARRYGVSLTLVQTVTRTVPPRAPLTIVAEKRSGGKAMRTRTPGVPMTTRRKIIAEHDRGMLQKEIAVRFGVSVGTVSNVIRYRDRIPAPPRARLAGHQARLLSPEQRAEATSLWLDGEPTARIASWLGARRELVKPFVQKLRARGGWYSLVYVRRCASCKFWLVTPRKHARFHTRCSTNLDAARRRALISEADDDA